MILDGDASSLIGFSVLRVQNRGHKNLIRAFVVQDQGRFEITFSRVIGSDHPAQDYGLVRTASLLRLYGGRGRSFEVMQGVSIQSLRVGAEEQCSSSHQ